MKNTTIKCKNHASAERSVSALTPRPEPPAERCFFCRARELGVGPMSEAVPLVPRPDQPGDRSVTKLRMTTGRKAHVLTIDVDVRGALRGPAEVIEMPFRKSDSPESSS